MFFLLLVILLFFNKQTLSNEIHKDKIHQIERYFSHFKEISPCTCDLNLEKCDPNCCCDEDCSDNAKGNMTCIEGLMGGNVILDYGIFPHQNCNWISAPMFTWASISDTHPFLCLIRQNSPFLGYFYQEDAILHSSTAIDAIKKNSNHRYSFLNKQLSNDDSFIKQYRYGTKIKTIYDQENGILGYLQMPQNILDGHCFMSPINYLKNQISSCVHTFQEISDCSDYNLLDHRLFLSQNNQQIKVRKNAKSVQSSVVKVNYYTTPSSYRYIKIFGHYEKAEFFKQDYQQSLISWWKKKHSYEIEKYRIYNPKPIFYVSSSRTCANIVLDVEYNIFWSGTNLTRIEANILLGNLSMKFNEITPKRKLSQQFKVTYHHEKDDELKEIQETTINPGYVKGDELRVGNRSILSDNITSEFDEKKSGDFETWIVSSTSLCRDSLTRRIRFLESQQVSCYIQLSKENFTDCQQLRDNLKSIFATLVSTSHLSRGQFPNITNPNEFVEIIYNDTQSNVTQLKINEKNYPFKTCLVPNQLNIEILYTQSDKKMSSINRITGTRVQNDYSKWQWTCNSGKCLKIRNYPITMRISYQPIPIVWKFQNITRFWIRQRTGECAGDTCFRDIFYPLNMATIGDEISYNIQCIIILIILSILYIFLTRLYW